MRGSFILALLAGPISFGIGCAAPGPDASEPDAAAPPRGVLRLGEGERSFRAVEDGDTLALVRGCQGAQHVWITLESQGMRPDSMVFEISLSHAEGGGRVATLRQRLSFTPAPNGEYARLTGLPLIVDAPDSAIGRDLVLRGWIQDLDGVEASAERRVRIAWGGSQPCEAG